MTPAGDSNLTDDAIVEIIELESDERVDVEGLTMCPPATSRIRGVFDSRVIPERVTKIVIYQRK